MQQEVRCPDCGYKNSSGQRFCKHCANGLATRCLQCFANVPAYSQFCPHCNWKDPNYTLQKEQARTLRKQVAQSYSHTAGKAGWLSDEKLQYTCPKCGARVEALSSQECPSRACGYIGPMILVQVQQEATSAAPGLASTEPIDTQPQVRSFSDKGGHTAGRERATSPPPSPLLNQVTNTEPREWRFPSLSRFVRPILAILVAGLVVSAAVVGGIRISHLVNQGNNNGTPSPITQAQGIRHGLSISVTPVGAGEVSVSPEGETYTTDTRIELMARAASGYAFDHWEGASGSSATATVVMDSSKSIVAYFQVKDTTSPVISGVEISGSADISATIAWKTDEAATGNIEYWTTDSDSKTVNSGNERTISHNVRLTGLQPNTTYYFKVKSKDKWGNEAIYEDQTLRTLRPIPVGHEIDTRAPYFALPSYEDGDPESPNNGSTVALSDFLGKNVMLNLWSTYCGPCIVEFPLIRAIYNNYDNNSGDIAVITVCIDGSVDRIKRIEDKYGAEYGPLTFPILLDLEREIEDSYHIWKIPKTLFIDSDGIIREIRIGRFYSQDEIESILESM